MSRRRRSRPRQRTFARPAPTLVSGESRPAQGLGPPPARPRFSRGGASRATGQPSQTLLRAATAEYGFVVKDLRRIAITAGGSVLLLALAAVAANTLIAAR
jgi:hypothetical protein